ncbi:hypothetical protein PUN28_011279 [Cardiocondyla obscurior]|uniref:Uncharacterized protein n=1 Tax=Cardiocondyla obscurior TaxID=286306 RepID=A0AAW2FGC7_9HYME
MFCHNRVSSYQIVTIFEVAGNSTGSIDVCHLACLIVPLKARSCTVRLGCYGCTCSVSYVPSRRSIVCLIRRECSDDVAC